MLPADDPSRRFYEELLARFGSDDRVVVSFRSDSLFTPEGVATLVRATRAVEGIPGVRSVEGLANAIRMRAIDGDVEIEGYLETLPSTRGEAEALRRALLVDPLRAGSFVSREGGATALLVTFERMPEQAFLESSLDLAVLEAARQAAPDMHVVLAGTPHVKAEVGRILAAELVRMVPVVFVLMGGLSCFFFRSLRIGLIPVAAVALGLVWTVGAMGWLGHDLNIVTTLIPPLVLVLGFAYATHVVASDRAHASAEEGLARVVFPVVFTAATTAAGFLSLLGNGLEVIRGFGLFAALATGATLVAALTLVPLLLVTVRRDGTSTPGAALERRFAHLAELDLRHARAILLGTASLAVLAGAAATRIEVNLPVIENFGPESRIRQAYAEVDRLYGGANQFFVMLQAEERGAFEQPAALREVAALQTWLEAQPEIGGTTSVVQYLEVLNEALGPEETPTRRIPDRADLVAQLLLFGANEELDVLLDRAHRVITILVRSTATETRQFDALARRIDARLAELPAGLRGHTTGNAILLTRAADRIARGQALSLLAAVGMIGLLLVAYFRSLRLGLLALVPNLLPVLFYFGLLGATGITLNNSTALMGSIVLGIAVDDTLHLLVEYRRGLAAHGDPAAAIREALPHVGRAITCTTVAVCAGLLVVGGSALRNQAEFGLLGAATLAIAWLVDVTVTPAMCVTWLRGARP
ncbi:MAG: MMPL family transporter [Spirochaetaceae bacterium]|nr:MMPL family transporter [Myxococcales bacterium]MCB9723420.1 MMPL family transporter [Spirochaetaceae bacterium]